MDTNGYTVLINQIVDSDTKDEVREGKFSEEEVFNMIQHASGENIEKVHYDGLPDNNYVAHCLGYDIYFTLCSD